MKHFLPATLGLILALSSANARSMSIIDAVYDAASDEIVFTIAYRGSHPEHTFSVLWESCRTRGDGRNDILGIVQDSDPRDPARIEFKKTERVSLKGFACRPGTVTIGLASPLYRRTLTIPAPKQ